MPGSRAGVDVVAATAAGDAARSAEPAVPAPRGRIVAVDLCTLPHSQHHPAVFARLQLLAADDRMIVACHYEPNTLFWQITGRWPGRFSWAWLDRGPLVWRVEIARTS